MRSASSWSTMPEPVDADQVGERVRGALVADRLARLADLVFLPAPHGRRSQDGRELRLALDDVLDLVVRATGDRLQILGTRSQGDTVTSPPPQHSAQHRAL